MALPSLLLPLPLPLLLLLVFLFKGMVMNDHSWLIVSLRWSQSVTYTLKLLTLPLLL